MITVNLRKNLSMREAGRVVAKRTPNCRAIRVQPTTLELNRLAEAVIVKEGPNQRLRALWVSIYDLRLGK